MLIGLFSFFPSSWSLNFSYQIPSAAVTFCMSHAKTKTTLKPRPRLTYLILNLWYCERRNFRCVCWSLNIPFCITTYIVIYKCIYPPPYKPFFSLYTIVYVVCGAFLLLFVNRVYPFFLSIWVWYTLYSGRNVCLWLLLGECVCLCVWERLQRWMVGPLGRVDKLIF